MNVAALIVFLCFAAAHCRPVERTKECGRSFLLESRMVDGKNITTDQQPWQVILVRHGITRATVFCSGALINAKYVLTAAHCVDGKAAYEITVKLGENTHMAENFLPEDRSVEEVHVHEYFDAEDPKNAYDIALLELSEAVVFGKHIAPICLPQSGADLSGQKAVMTGLILGHGRGQMFSFAMNEMDSTVTNDSFCQAALGNHGFKEPFEHFVCSLLGENRACVHMIQGPLILEKDGFFQIIGVAPEHSGCGSTDPIIVHSRISSHLEWIIRTIKGFGDNPEIEPVSPRIDFDVKILVPGVLLLIGFALFLVLL